MPEFTFDQGGTVEPGHTWRTLDSFVQGYISALLFTESSPAFDSESWFTDERRAATEGGQADGELPGDVGFADFHPDALAAIIADCEKFQADNAALLESAYELEPGGPDLPYAREPLDDERAGMLFWYARNGHGVGWTDNGNAQCLADLQDASAAFGESYPFFGDHTEHGDSPFIHIQ